MELNTPYLDIPTENTRFDINVLNDEHGIVKDKELNLELGIRIIPSKKLILIMLKNQISILYMFDNVSKTIVPLTEEDKITYDQQIKEINKLIEINSNISILYYKYTNLASFKLYINVDYLEAQKELEHISNKLKKICGDLTLKLDRMYNMEGKLSVFSSRINDLVICLYYKNNCIASVIFESDAEGFITIDSKTHQNKYNKLLIAIAILVSKYIKINNIEVTSIKSYAIDPIEAYLLLTYFNAKIDRTIKAEAVQTPESIISEQDEKNKSITMDKINEYIDIYRGLELNIDINDEETIRLTNDVYTELLESDKHIKCPTDVKNSILKTPQQPNKGGRRGRRTKGRRTTKKEQQKRRIRKTKRIIRK